MSEDQHEITIGQLLDAKAACEREILAAIAKFTGLSGFTVESVSLQIYEGEMGKRGNVPQRAFVHIDRDEL